MILATGSDPVVPAIEGFDREAVWTNRQATQLREIPERAVVLGGGPVGLELGQFLARFGCRVTLVQSPDRLIDRRTRGLASWRGGRWSARASRSEGFVTALERLQLAAT